MGPSSELLVRERKSGALVVETREQAVRRPQSLVRRYIRLKPGASIVDEFLDERRKQAARESSGNKGPWLWDASAVLALLFGEALDALRLDIVAFGYPEALDSARYASVEILSLGDRACLATASLRHWPVLTAGRF